VEQVKSISNQIQSEGQPWFRSVGWDWMWFLSGYWIFPLFFCIYLFFGNEHYLTIAAAIFIMTRLSHIYISMYLCIGHPAYKPIARESKWRFFGIPFLITLFFTLFFLLPFDFLPRDTESRLKIYAFFTFPYVYYHYALQHYGVLSMYRSRAKQRLSPFHMKFERVFCHLVVSLTISALTLNNFYEVSLGGYSFSKLFNTEALNWNAIAWSIIVPITIWYIVLELKNDKPSIPKMLYATSMSLMSLVLTLDSFLISWLLVDMQHTLCIFGLGGHILANYDVKTNKIEAKKAIWKHYGILVLVSVAFSLIHFYFAANGTDNKHYKFVYDGLIPQTDKESVLRVFFYGFFIGLGIAHYYYDRLAFRFSDKRIGEVLRKYI
jgi:hypothetical protein